MKLQLSTTEVPKHYNISLLSNSKFRDYMYEIIGNKDTKNWTIVIPKFISTRNIDKYCDGFVLYLELAIKINRDIIFLTEEEIYFAGVVAYHFKDLSPLRIKVQQLSDKYYWFYLANNKELFYPTMEIEMYRRRTTTSIKLINLEKHTFQIKGIDESKAINYYNSDTYFTIKHNARRFNGIDYGRTHTEEVETSSYEELHNEIVNTNIGNIFKNMEKYNLDLYGILEKILQEGAVIAGGFVNSIVSPTYILKYFGLESIGYNIYSKNKELGFIKDNHDYSLYTIGLEIRRQGDDIKFDQIKGMVDLTIAFYSDGANPFARTVEEKKFEKLRKLLRNYDTFKALEELKENIIQIDDALYQMFFQYSPDIDIFITGDNYLDKVEKIISILKDIIIKVYFSEFATTLYLGRHFPKIQIIKRAYSNVDEILAGFDIDPSRVAMIWKKDKIRVIAPKSYINAVEYGVNLVVPSRQSQTFNNRLLKYFNKGFLPYFPFGIDRTKNKTNEVMKGLPLLIQCINKDSYTAINKSSDYGSNRVSTILRDFDDWKYGPDLTGKLINMDIIIIMIIIIKGKLSGWSYLNDPVVRENVQLLKLSKSLLICAIRYITSLFWRVTNPGSQITSSFNPTTLDYLAGVQTDILPELSPVISNEDEPIKLILDKYLPATVYTIIIQYKDIDVDLIYKNLSKLNRAIEDREYYVGKYSDLGKKLLIEFKGGKEVKLEIAPSKEKRIFTTDQHGTKYWEYTKQSSSFPVKKSKKKSSSSSTKIKKESISSPVKKSKKKENSFIKKSKKKENSSIKKESTSSPVKKSKKKNSSIKKESSSSPVKKKNSSVKKESTSSPVKKSKKKNSSIKKESTSLTIKRHTSSSTS